MEKVNKNDFIEIEFTGICENEVFDTTNPEEAKQIGLQNLENIKPLIISVGNNMVLKGFDEQLIYRELDKEYKINLTPENAFGSRNPGLIKIYSLNNFKKQDINPYPGMTLQLDNLIARVISVSGGRVIVDFNNPLAGKSVSYNFKILRKIDDDNEKINALQEFFFKKRLDFEIKEEKSEKEKDKNKTTKKVILKDKNIEPFLNLLKDKFKEMTGFEFEVENQTRKEERKKDSGKEEMDKESKGEKKVEGKKENSEKKKKGE